MIEPSENTPPEIRYGAPWEGVSTPLANPYQSVKGEEPDFARWRSLGEVLLVKDIWPTERDILMMVVRDRRKLVRISSSSRIRRAKGQLRLSSEDGTE